MARCSRITGSLGKSVEEVLQHNIIDTHISSSKSPTVSGELLRLAENKVIRKLRKVHSMLFM
jgi:hypothetical protein